MLLANGRTLATLSVHLVPDGPFKIILDVTMFMGERSLSFRGSIQCVGDLHNGNFLGILELISHYDPILREHVTNVQISQENAKGYKHTICMIPLRMSSSRCVLNL